MSRTILNFHGIGPIPRNIDSGEYECWLDQEFFYAVLDSIVGRSHVKITVDDGNASDFDIVLPALLQRGLRADFFICSGRLDQPAFLNCHQVRKLLDHGMGIGSHGINHVPWRGLSSSQLSEELNSSRRILENVCGSPVDTAACPFGAYDRKVLGGLQKAGYRHVYTSDGGICTDSQWLRARTTITRSMGLDELWQLIQQGCGASEQLMINARKLFKRFR